MKDTGLKGSYSDEFVRAGWECMRTNSRVGHDDAGKC